MGMCGNGAGGLMTSVDIPMSSDTYLSGYTAQTTVNYSTSTVMYVGEAAGYAACTRKSLLKPDFSLIPAGRLFASAILKITPTVDYTSNVRTMRAYRCLRAVVYAQATWVIYSTGNNWGTAGCSNSSTDYDGAVELGNMSVPNPPTLNVPLEMTLDASELQKIYDGTYVNNGIVLLMDTQVDDQCGYATTEHATATYRPIITINHLGMDNFFSFFL
jgi:hypothetical protein